MSLTGAPILVLAGVLAAVLPVASVLIGRRQRHGRAPGIPLRLLMVVLSQLAAVLLAGLWVNDSFALYESWSDLLGTDQPAVVVGGPSTPGQRSDAVPATGVTGAPELAVLPRHRGRVLKETWVGPQSHVRAKVWVLLPPDYEAAARAGRRFPVVEFLPGYPGTPTTWLHALKLQQVLDAEVAAGRAAPFLAVLPEMNVAMPRDTECTDVPNGPQVATWLGQDVPDLVSTQLAVAPPGAGWAVTGYSTGGFCAAKLTLTYPRRFGSGAALAGYFHPERSSQTGDLFGHDPSVRDRNDPLWLLTHRPPPPVHLLTVFSQGDPGTAGQARELLAAARPPVQVQQIALSHGGHNTGVWLTVEPALIDWLSQHLS